MSTKPTNSETLLNRLLAIKAETQNLDFKTSFNWAKASNRDKLELIKDVLSMANIKDGGHILIGITDENYESIGIDGESFSSFDTTSFNQFLQKYTDPAFSCHVHKVDNGKKFIIIDIPEFQEVPIIAKQDGHDSEGKHIIKAGQIYYRTDKATCGIISSALEMRELLGRALIKRKHDLLHSIESIIQGRPPENADSAKEAYKKEIQSAKISFHNHFPKADEYPHYWELLSYPEGYISSRLKDQKEIKTLVKESTVNLRGWPFPVIESPAEVFNTQDGIESNWSNLDEIESCRFFKSGLFFWRSYQLKDEVDSNHQAKILCFISAIYQITEYFIFLSRFYNSFEASENIVIELTASGLQSRKLVLSDWRVPGLHHRSYYTAGENQYFFRKTVSTAELSASFKELASEAIQGLFLLFNMENMTPETIATWQNKLIKREY